MNYDELKLLQNLPLDIKVLKSQQRIREWHAYFGGDIYVSFSGGKDSTVLLDICRNIYPNIEAVFIDTGLEYPEIRDFVKTVPNVTVLKPKIPFTEVIKKYGYPVISKEQAQYIQQYRNAKSAKTKYTRLNGNKWGRGKISNKWLYLLDAPFLISERCCDIMKKNPAKEYEKISGKAPIIGVLAGESAKRVQDYLRFGCNAFDAKRPVCRPLAFWSEQDILEYLMKNNLNYSSVYGEIVNHDNSLKLTGVDRTGCMFCMFGAHLDNSPNRFQRMRITHPKIYEYCMDKLGLKEVLDYIKVKYD